MKKLVIILVLLISITNYLSAFGGEKKDNKPDKLGIRAGFQNSSWQKDGSELKGTDPYKSFYLGLFKENKIIPMIHVGAGLEYMQCGAKMPSDNNYVLSYLGVPVYLKGKLGPFYALLGAGLNFKVAEKYDDADALPADQNIKSMDVPIFSGIGVRFLMISIEGRYHWGMSDLNNGVKNRYLQLGAAISF